MELIDCRMKYWSRVSGNRWLVAKMFGVYEVSNPSVYPVLKFSRLMVFFLLWVLVAG